jgi:hypothetical protein
MVLTLDSNLANALRERARQQGIAPEALALQTLREPFLPVEPRDEWERQLLAAATDCGVSLPNAALSSEGLYD